ncbi:hypothetical protein F511_15863 [Dorcoceras hygrometricum]|uniref:Uncharacterized protein n=1 Tax=Dorcoceras hygrometricum TaxID=472368 RepID=A0A2Z7CXE2_9LAMI|nr:hypothetical protein F511_15863 [Dorcoceras hygrometricum]
MAGALPDGPPTHPVGPILTDHGVNRARMKENDPLKDSARRCAEKHAARGVPLPAYGSTAGRGFNPAGGAPGGG